MSQKLEQFGKYILLERLASGGMAEVYLAKSAGASGVNKYVAIKRILPEHSKRQDFIDMFKDEAKIAINLQDSNIVQIFDFGIEHQQFYIVMEYVEGRNLRQVLNELKKMNSLFSIDQIVFIIKEVAAGLDHAHRCLNGTTGEPFNITHRDISPQNVMISFEGEIKIIDFGIAKADFAIEPTKAETIKGKFGYMSPEQTLGEALDHRTDIFSLGIVLWELLADDRLFTGDTEKAILKKIRDCHIPNIKKLSPVVPSELAQIIGKMLAKDKDLRYQSASNLYRDLNRFLNTHYPEFSTHDFSVFMKVAFTDQIKDIKRRLVDYSKIEYRPDNDATVITTVAKEYFANLESESEKRTSQKTSLFEQTPKEQTPKKQIIDPVPISLLRPAVWKKKGLPKSKTVSRITRWNRTLSPQHYENTFFNFENFRIFLAAVLTVVISFYFAKKVKLHSNLHRPKKNEVRQVASVPQSKPPQESKPQEKDTQCKTRIESKPSFAKIYVDGIDSGKFTPSTLILQGNRKYKIAIQKDGYQPLEKELKISSKARSVAFITKLKPLPKSAYINIRANNSGENPIIEINGQVIPEKLPLELYPIPANTKVKVRVFNPVTRLEARRIVNISPNKKVELDLILEPLVPPTN